MRPLYGKPLADKRRASWHNGQMDNYDYLIAGVHAIIAGREQASHAMHAVTGY
jgi:hypothetical protein